MNRRRAALACLGAAIAGDLRAAGVLTFGVMQAGSAEHARKAWQPLVDGMSRRLRRQVELTVSPSYADLLARFKSGLVQVAWVDNRMAIELFESRVANVFAQMVRSDGTRGYKSLMLARSDGPVSALDDVFTQSGKLSLAMGDKQSTSGFLVPSYYLFAKRKMDAVRHFARVSHGSHRDNFSALAAGKADLAVNNSEEVPYYRAERSSDWARTRVLWESPLIPNDPIVMRNDLSPGLQERVRNSFIEYGQGGAAERATLKAINNLSAFAASGNYQLIPIVDLQMYESVTLAMADGSRTQAQKDEAVAELYKRASRLSTAMSASRYNLF